MTKSGKTLSAACAIALLFFAPAKTGAIELLIAGGAGNAGFTSASGLPQDVSPAFTFGVSGEMREGLSAGFEIEQDAVFGRKIAAALSYDAGFIALEMGPVFGFLNGTDGNSIKNGLLQPGLRLGVSLFFLDRIMLEASSDFCIQAGQEADGILYPAQSRVALGAAFPAIVLSLEINQKRATISGSSGYSQTRTDYGLYTRMFGKNSPFRMSVNFIYRTLDFARESTQMDISNKSLVIGGGVELRVKMVDIFLNGEGSVYTFEDSGSNPFLFNVMAGMKIRTR